MNYNTIVTCKTINSVREVSLTSTTGLTVSRDERDVINETLYYEGLQRCVQTESRHVQ